MIILGLDTAMAACSVAVIDTGTTAPISSRFEAMERGHAEALAPMVQRTMREAALPFSAIERIAVTTGPGTFTGIRVGLAMARGLGLALGIPVVGIDTLTAIAANDVSGLPLLILADARNAEVYAASFDGDKSVLTGPRVMAAADSLELLPQGGLLLGSGAAQVAPQGTLLSPANGLPDAKRFAQLASLVPAPAGMPPPLYLRAPDAKPQLLPLRRAAALTFRTADAPSAAMLSAVHAEAFDTPWSAAEFAALLVTPGALATIACEQGEPVGFILTRRAADEAEILTVCTRPQAQRRGVAAALLDRQFAELSRQGTAAVFIEVDRANAAARGLYDKAGFKTAGLRKLYYQHADGTRSDAIVMRRTLVP